MQLQEEFDKYHCCVIIPTYNNDKTLKEVVNDVLLYTKNIIIVNDGASDTTSQILLDYQERVDIITHTFNKGKGKSLRSAFKYALQKGYEYAITIDSDGQHYSSDLPFFLSEIEQNPHTLVIGSRNMNQENVPSKSSFGNKFSNFWFQFETGIKLEDTQSGYRLYPIKKMEYTSYLTNRFEFEVEVIVKAAWQGIAVKNIPVKVHYDPEEKRISHFRPFQDFTRISILNTYLVILALAYYIPFRFVKLLNKENIKVFIKKHFFDQTQPVHVKAMSIGFGVFMGIFPVWGYQLLIGIPLAHFFKLNKALFILAANISIPPMIPVIIYSSYRIGYFFVSNPSNDILFKDGLTIEAVKSNLVQYLAGAVLLSVVMGVLFTLVSYIYFLMRKKV
ncbi:MAG: DUF2062 domain-containing protein [Cyclobacteriaceae bacterium]|nr:DUF2062 domain-containing protein [Cyclobacteriaceae bacterium]